MHTLTETPAWSATISVPDAADNGAARHTAAEVTAQGLANRTAYLKTVAEGAVQEAGGNMTGDLTVDGHIIQTGGAHVLQTAGNATIGGDLTVGDDLTVSDTLTVNGGSITAPNASLTLGSGSLHLTSGTAYVGGNIEVGGDILLANPGEKIKYSTMTALFRRVAISSGNSPQPVSGANSVAFYGGSWNVLNTAYEITIPLPYFATLSELVEVYVAYQLSGAVGSVEVFKRSITSWLGTPVVSDTSLATASLNHLGGGNKVSIATLASAEVLDNQSYEYYIRLTGGAGSTATILGVQVAIKPYSPGII